MRIYGRFPWVINRSLACTRVSYDHELVQNRILVGESRGYLRKKPAFETTRLMMDKTDRKIAARSGQHQIAGKQSSLMRFRLWIATEELLVSAKSTIFGPKRSRPISASASGASASLGCQKSNNSDVGPSGRKNLVFPLLDLIGVYVELLG